MIYVIKARTNQTKKFFFFRITRQFTTCNLVMSTKLYFLLACFKYINLRQNISVIYELKVLAFRRTRIAENSVINYLDVGRFLVYGGTYRKKCNKKQSRKYSEMGA